MRALVLAAATALLFLVACGGSSDDPLAERAARIEQQLLASCSCHPKKIEGLPLEAALRTSIRTRLEAGQDDDAILWAVLQEHGTALLEAGVEDVETRALAVAVMTPLILLVGAGVLLLQLRRDS